VNSNPAAPVDLLMMSGQEALKFAQAQVSSDLRTLAVGEGQWSAWLNPQGRVIAFFPMFRTGETEFCAAIAFGRGQEILDRMQRFVFRSKVKLSITKDLAIVSGPLDPADVIAGMDLLGEPPARLFLTRSTEASPWQPGLPELLAGLPFLDGAASEQFIGHALGLKRLGAVAVDKGCYPGQEIVARMHFLGRNKRQPCVLRSDEPFTGIAVRAGDPPTPAADLAWAIEPFALAVLHNPESAAKIDADTNLRLHVTTVFADS